MPLRSIKQCDVAGSHRVSTNAAIAILNAGIGDKATGKQPQTSNPIEWQEQRPWRLETISPNAY